MELNFYIFVRTIKCNFNGEICRNFSNAFLLIENPYRY